ncbi:hypothetical protein ITJ86_08510 [Winogradskyella sp. F6397]|uniref:Outer membrane protein beta-barrel domain-containing protein n=1 Tax=Winogradskyella marina TaxID=2785530 RepID=A0ABS0EHM0_9FLAO|nr:hypothetical protein [Winogradskyella marina]MBF8149938.1 hypothetical protein [Winogradskyella marina]
MKHYILIVVLLCCTTYTMGQTNTFEAQAALIASRIDSITTVEKSTLKKALQKLDEQVEKKEMTFEAAEVEKKKLASYHAKRINDAVSNEEQKLQALIRNKVSGKFDLYAEENEQNRPFISVFEDENFYNDSISGLKVEKRLTTQFVVAFGMNTILNDDSGYYGDGFKSNLLGNSELGFTFKYKLKEESIFWNLKFGLSMMVDSYKPKEDNLILVKNDDETTLQDSGYELKRSRLDNMAIALPIHIEIDLSKPQYHSKTEQTYLRSQRGFRMGLGGYFAVRIYTSQFIRFDDENGLNTQVTQQNNFNLNNINFGPSAYIGYRDVSFYAKYDVNPIFKNNPDDINTISFGLRLDLN